MNRIDLVPRGWEQEPWIRTFYPDDLPEEWRLCYFANEFSSVLLPRTTWLGVADDVVTAWAEDLPAGFRVYLEGVCAAHEGKLDRVLSALGGHLVGVVNDEAGIRKSGQVSFSFRETPASIRPFSGMNSMPCNTNSIMPCMIFSMESNRRRRLQRLKVTITGI